MAPPRMLAAPTIALPMSYRTAQVGGLVTEEIVVERDGTVRDLRLVGATLELLAPFAENSLQRARFAPGAIENNPVAIRGLLTTVVGATPPADRPLSYATLRAFVPGGESREARWQLRDSVRRIELAGRAPAALPRGAEIVARAPNGAERRLDSLPASSAAGEFRRTASAGDFFAAAGDYGIEIREAGKTLARAVFTVAPDAAHAVVNSCEPIERPATLPAR
jgi:hypothetical protein